MNLLRFLEDLYFRLEVFPIGKAGAAEILGVNPGTLRHRMRKLGIVFGRAAKTA